MYKFSRVNLFLKVEVLKMCSLKNFFTAVLLTLVATIFNIAEAAIVADKMPLQCYVDHKVTSYDKNDGREVGWIDADVDLVEITGINVGTGVALGTHPSGSRRVERIFWARDVFADLGYRNRPAHVSGYHEVYRTKNSSATIGSIRDEEVTVVADNGNRAQIIYRLDNGTGYKMGWVPSSIVNGGGGNVTNYAQPAEGEYYIVPINSTCAIDVPNNWTNEGTVLQIYNKNDSPAQTFKLERVANYWYKIVHPTSGHVINVQYGNNGNGTRLWLYHYDGSASCHWRFRDLGGGVYNIESQLPSNPFLEVQNGNPFSGAVLQLWQQHNGNAAKWTLKKASSPPNNKLQELVNRWVGQTWSDHYYSPNSKQCKEFASYIFNELYGIRTIGSGSTETSSTSHILENVPNSVHKLGTLPSNNKSVTAENIRDLFRNAKPGDFVQMRRSYKNSRGYYSPHSAIVFSVTNDGVEFFEANAKDVKTNQYIYNKILKQYYSYSKLAEMNQGISIYSAQ